MVIIVAEYLKCFRNVPEFPFRMTSVGGRCVGGRCRIISYFIIYFNALISKVNVRIANICLWFCSAVLESDFCNFLLLRKSNTHIHEENSCTVLWNSVHMHMGGRESE